MKVVRMLLYKALVLSLLGCAVLAAQNVSSSLSGFVQDKSGAAFPGVEIKVTGLGTGFVRTTRANHEGFFSFPDLTSASYILPIESPGFKRYTQTGIELGSSEQRSLGAIRLELGEVAESISVTADANPIVLSSPGSFTARERGTTGMKTWPPTTTSTTSAACCGRPIVTTSSAIP